MILKIGFLLVVWSGLVCVLLFYFFCISPILFFIKKTWENMFVIARCGIHFADVLSK